MTNVTKVTILSLFLIVLLSVPSFASDSCIVSEPCTFYAYGLVAEDGVNITYYYSNESEIGEYAMNLFSSGKYSHSITINVSDNILGCARSYNSTSTITEVCESKLVDTSNTAVAEVGYLNFTLIGGVAVVTLMLLMVSLYVGLGTKRQ